MISTYIDKDNYTNKLEMLIVFLIALIIILIGILYKLSVRIMTLEKKLHDLLTSIELSNLEILRLQEQILRLQVVNPDTIDSMEKSNLFYFIHEPTVFFIFCGIMMMATYYAYSHNYFSIDNISRWDIKKNIELNKTFLGNIQEDIKIINCDLVPKGFEATNNNINKLSGDYIQNHEILSQKCDDCLAGITNINNFLISKFTNPTTLESIAISVSEISNNFTSLI